MRTPYSSNFKRKTNPSVFPTCSILGVDIAVLSMEPLVGFILEHLDDLHGDYITVANVHTVVTAYEDPEYLKIQNGGVLAIPDGAPLSKYAKRKGYRDIQRTTGPSLMEELLGKGRDGGCKHYFFGSTEDTLAKIKSKLQADYPDVKVAGLFSPPFRNISKEEDEEQIRMINDSGANIVWVGLGAPKQEKWMADHQGKVNALMIGVGAAFDYFAGNIKRAPKWMQKLSLEWLYRLMQNPKLIKRYMGTNSKYLWLTRVKRK